MESFKKLLDIAQALHGPKGCPWDKEQTFLSLRPFLLEELHEVLEAVDEDNTKKMIEELGDLLFLIISYAMLGQKNKRFNFEDILKGISHKMIQRHPHVFGSAEVKNSREVIDQWEQIKKEEKKERKSPLEGISKTLYPLARAQKVLDKMSRLKFAFPTLQEPSSSESRLGNSILKLIIDAHESGIDAESALRGSLKRFENALEKEF